MDESRTTDALRAFGFLLKDVSRLFSRNFERHGVELGLTLAQCRVLSYVQRHAGLSQARLAELTDTDPMTLGRLLLRMEADGFIERRADPRDGRAHCLHLRPRAGPMLEAIWRVADRSRAEALAGFSASDRAHLMSLLGRLRDNLDALVSGPAVRDTGAPTAAVSALSRRPRKAA